MLFKDICNVQRTDKLAIYAVSFSFTFWRDMVVNKSPFFVLFSHESCIVKNRIDRCCNDIASYPCSLSPVASYWYHTGKKFLSVYRLNLDGFPEPIGRNEN